MGGGGGTQAIGSTGKMVPVMDQCQATWSVVRLK